MSATFSMLGLDTGCGPAAVGRLGARRARLSVLSAQDLRDAVRRSRPGSVNVELSALDRVLRHDLARAEIEVQSHASWRTLIAILAAHLSQDVACLSALDDETTIDSALATNAPGPDGCPLIRHVVALSIVTADGELRRASREVNEDLFRHVIGGHGLFGLAYSFTLSIESLLQSCSNACAPAVLDLSEATQHAGPPLRLLIPPEALHEALEQIVQATTAWRVPIQRAEVREIQADGESALPWASRDYALISLSVRCPDQLGGRVRKEQLDRELIDLAIAHRGAYPIACTPQASARQLATCYPKLRDFIAQVRRFDPAGRFDSPWLRHHRRLLRS